MRRIGGPGCCRTRRVSDLPDIGPDTLDLLWAEHSLRSLSLTWNYETDYGFSCYDDATAPLKPAGRELLRALERSPLFLDLAHLNDAGFYEALDLYAPPVLVTHSFCRAIGDHPRGLTDEQLRALGEHGGLVGLAFDPDFLGSRDPSTRRCATSTGSPRWPARTPSPSAAIGEWPPWASWETLRALVGLVDAVERQLRPGPRREVRVRQRLRLPQRRSCPGSSGRRIALRRLGSVTAWPGPASVAARGTRAAPSRRSRSGERVSASVTGMPSSNS